ncbi:MAG: hypothetical protein AAFW65_01610 [Pseudomonadota bacterium]
MDRFTAREIETIDSLWRAVPQDHVWSGWAATGDQPREIWIFRTKAHWRRFPLKKEDGGYALFDERDRRVARAPSLERLLRKVEAIPGISD